MYLLACRLNNWNILRRKKKWKNTGREFFFFSLSSLFDIHCLLEACERGLLGEEKGDKKYTIVDLCIYCLLRIIFNDFPCCKKKKLLGKFTTVQIHASSDIIFLGLIINRFMGITLLLRAHLLGEVPFPCWRDKQKSRKRWFTHNCVNGKWEQHLVLNYYIVYRGKSDERILICGKGGVGEACH